MKIKKLGPYKLLSVLGRGGMGTVYRAENTETGNCQAVKVLAEHFAHDTHFRNRFESEIKALIKLDHPNIVRLISYGQEDSNLFFAMELVEGKNLFQLQRDGKRFDWREVLSITRDIANGLKHAHDRGVIHRDLKPGNLLASTDGLIKITDFGIAKNFGNSSNTGSNVLGTMDFMSPEQAKGNPVTVKSDLYSLGSVMYCLLSGRPPHRGNSVEETLHNLTRATPPHITQSAPNVPPELDSLISRMMEPDPEKRVATAQSLLYQIESVEQQLKDYSEAKTTERPAITAHDTFAIGKPATAEERDPSSYSNSTAIESEPPATADKKNHLVGKTEVKTAPEEVTGSTHQPDSHIDYFNTVTDQQRQRHTNKIDSQNNSSLRNIALTGIPLLVAVVLIVFGIFKVYQRPSADQLYSVIAASPQNPQRVQDEISQFLEYYPDHEMVNNVQSLQSLGRAIALRKRLTIRSESIAGAKLTDVEDQFVDIMQLSRKDVPAAYSQLSAFVTLYQGDPNLKEMDKACLEAAQIFTNQLKEEAESEQLAGQQRIDSIMKRAETAPPAEATKLYQSIIELYGGSKWAQPLIEQAKQRLRKTGQE